MAQTKKRTTKTRKRTATVKKRTTVHKASLRRPTTAQTPTNRGAANAVTLAGDVVSPIDTLVVKPLMGREIDIPINSEPLLMRFRHGERNLNLREIEALYFGHQSKADEYAFLTQIEREADEAIRASKYLEALRIVQRGLWRNPLHLGLLSRACELANHEKQAELDLYVWQMGEILNLIENTGDGTTHEKAYRVMSRGDAILFETLWREKPLSSIVERRELLYEGKPLLALTIQEPGSVTKVVRYYSIRK